MVKTYTLDELLTMDRDELCNVSYGNILSFIDPYFCDDGELPHRGLLVGAVRVDAHERKRLFDEGLGEKLKAHIDAMFRADIDKHVAAFEAAYVAFAPIESSADSADPHCRSGS